MSILPVTEGGTGANGLLRYSVLVGNNTDPVGCLAINPGQVIIGNKDFPVSAFLTRGPGINVINKPGSITIEAANYTNVGAGAPVNLIPNTSYIIGNNGGIVNFVLPSIESTVTGMFVEIVNVSSNGWSITQMPGQQIIGKIGLKVYKSSVGPNGSLVSSSGGQGYVSYDCVKLVCGADNATWVCAYITGEVKFN